jgi:chromosome partitioning protein
VTSWQRGWGNPAVFEPSDPAGADAADDPDAESPISVVEPLPQDVELGGSVDDESSAEGSAPHADLPEAMPSEVMPSEVMPSEIMPSEAVPSADGRGDLPHPTEATWEPVPVGEADQNGNDPATSQSEPAVTGPGDTGSIGDEADLSDAALARATLAVVTGQAEAPVLGEAPPPPPLEASVPTAPESVIDVGGQPIPAMAPRTQPRPLPRTLAIANQKGGVGKTTTAVNLGAGLAAQGYRTLVIDLDPQGNATTGLGIDARNLSASIYDVLLADRPLEDAVEPTAVRNLFVVPATLDLAGAEIELVPAFSRELKLRRAVDGLDGQFDFTLIDCPPSLGLLTVNGLAAADEVLVPVQCEYYALEGLGQLLRNIQLVQSNLNPGLELSTIVLTMYDARTKLSDQVASEVRSHFGDRVCRNIVPRSVRLSEAPSFGQPIIVFDPSSRGSIAYRELAKEVSGGAPRRTG